MWKVLFLAPSVCGFLFGWTDLLQIHTEDVWSLTRTSLKVEVKGQESRSPRTKHGIFRPIRRPRPACGLCLVKHL